MTFYFFFLKTHYWASTMAVSMWSAVVDLLQEWPQFSILPIINSSAIWLCSFFCQVAKFISPPLVLVLALWLTLPDRMGWKWQYYRSEPGSQEAMHSSTQPLGIILLLWEQAWASLPEDVKLCGLITPITLDKSQITAIHLNKSIKDQPAPADLLVDHRQVSLRGVSQACPDPKHPLAML